MKIAWHCWLVSLATLALAGCERPVAERGEPATSEAESSTPALSDQSAPQRPVATEEAAPLSSDGQLHLEKISFTIPKDWRQKEPLPGFILAEFALPRAEGADVDGRLTVSVAGGDIEANIDRWRSQFNDKPEKSSQEKLEANGLEITVVDFSGEFNDQRGPFAPAAVRSGYRMLAAIIPVDEQLHFVKATGPEATIAAHADRFHEFIKSVKRN